MTTRYYPGRIMLLLTALCLTFGTPTLAATTPSPLPHQQPGGSPPPEPSAIGDDGFQKTVTFFQSFKKQGGELEALLQKVTAAAPGSQNQGANFLKLLSQQYPGATFNGREGTIPLRKDLVAHFTDTLKIDRITEVGGITVGYLLSQGLIHLTDGTNAATILIDQAVPSKSTFIDVNIAAIKGQAEKIVTDPERKRIAAEPAESAVLTDAYQLLSMVAKLRMDIFAGNMMRDPALQQKALKIAAKGYRERHPQDYQAVDPNQKKTIKTDAKPDKPADQRFYDGFLRIFAFVLSAAAVLWLVFALIRFMKTQSLDNARKMRQGKYQQLSPMVRRILRKTGNSLWGRNLPWAKNYYIYDRNERWLLCDGREEKINKISQARTRIEICLRSTYFKVKLTRLNNAKANIWVSSQGLSKRALMEGLEEIIREMTNPTGRDDGADDETESMASSVDSTPQAAGTESALSIQSLGVVPVEPAQPPPCRSTGAGPERATAGTRHKR